MSKADPNKVPSFHDLFPNLSAEELKEAEERLDAYIDLLLQMHERIQKNPEANVLVEMLMEQKSGNGKRSLNAE